MSQPIQDRLICISENELADILRDMVIAIVGYSKLSEGEGWFKKEVLSKSFSASEVFEAGMNAMEKAGKNYEQYEESKLTKS